MAVTRTQAFKDLVLPQMPRGISLEMSEYLRGVENILSDFFRGDFFVTGDLYVKGKMFSGFGSSEHPSGDYTYVDAFKIDTLTGLLKGASGVVSAITTSSELSSVISDELGSGYVLFGDQAVKTTSNVTFAIATITSQLKILESGGTPSKYTIFQCGDQSVDVTYTLPTALPETNKYLQCTSGGILTWETIFATGDDYGRSGVATDLYEGTTKLSAKYLGISDKAADSDKWDGYDFATYLNQTLLTTDGPTFDHIHLNGMDINAVAGTISYGNCSISIVDGGNITIDNGVFGICGCSFDADSFICGELSVGGNTIDATHAGYVYYMQSVATTDAPTFTHLHLNDATSQIVLDADGTYKGTLTMASLNSNRTWTLPNNSGTIHTTSSAIPVSQYGTGATSFNAYGVICAGSTSTGALTSIVNNSTAGKVLMTTGAASIPAWSTPTFPNAAPAAGKFIIGDGTNWIESTPKLPTAAPSAGTFLRGDGTDWKTSTLTIPNTMTSSHLLYTSLDNTVADLDVTDPLQITGSPAGLAIKDASTTQKGAVELAIDTETSAGSSTSLAVCPDGLAGSKFGTKTISVQVVPAGTNVTTSHVAYIAIPECMDGFELVRAQAHALVHGHTSSTFMIARGRNSTDQWAFNDMLSADLTIADGQVVGTENTSISSSYKAVAENDIIKIYVKTVASSTVPQGLLVVLEFRLP